MIQQKILIMLMILVGATFKAKAQDTSKLEAGRIEPYQLYVTYDKTTHLIFPAAIRYVDLGSGYLIADKAEGAENVLRVKSTLESFDKETNFSVVTQDGRFYNFNAYYSPYPATLNYDIEKMLRAGQRISSSDVLLEELGSSSPSFAETLLETIYNQGKRIIRHIGSRSYGIQALLKGIYIDNGKYFFLLEINNKTNVPFRIDFINFKIVDKKLARRTVIQEQPLKPLRVYQPVESLPVYSKERNVFMLDQFTIAGDKILLIEVFEKNGGRHQVLQVGYTDLIRAKKVSEMHLNTSVTR